jgi:hypothetical protein
MHYDLTYELQIHQLLMDIFRAVMYQVFQLAFCSEETSSELPARIPELICATP